MRKVLALAALVVAVAGCSDWNDDRGLGDAPVGEKHEAAREVWVMPDGFPNLAVVCIDRDLILVTTRPAPPVVIPDAPRCQA